MGATSHTLLLNMENAQATISSEEFIRLGYAEHVLALVRHVVVEHVDGKQPSRGSDSEVDDPSACIALQAARIIAVLLPQIAGTAANGALSQRLARYCAVASMHATAFFDGQRTTTRSRFAKASVSRDSDDDAHTRRRTAYQMQVHRIRLLNAFAIARTHLPVDELVVHGGVNCLFPYLDIPVVSSPSATGTATGAAAGVACAMCGTSYGGFVSSAAVNPNGAGYLLPPCACFADQFRVKSTCAQCASSFHKRHSRAVPCSYCKSACCRNCCSLAVMQLEGGGGGGGAAVRRGLLVNVCVHCYRVSRHIHFPIAATFELSLAARRFNEELRSASQ